MTEEADIRVRRNHAERRWEVTVGGTLAGVLVYAEAPGGGTILHHTEVRPDFEGQGLGGRLARAALEETHADGGPVLVECPFVTSWVRRHPEWLDRVTLAGADDRDRLA